MRPVDLDQPVVERAKDASIRKFLFGPRSESGNFMEAMARIRRMGILLGLI